LIAEGAAKMNRPTFLAPVVLAIALPIEALAATWCSSTYPTDPPMCRCSALWCEDVDRACNGAPACPPAPPETCTDLNTYGPAQIRQILPRTSYINDDPANECGVEFKHEDGDDWVSSPPFATRFPKGQLGQATVDLTDDIQYKWGQSYNRIIATDMQPLVLRFDMCGGTDETDPPPTYTNVHVQWDIGVLELFLDTGVPNVNRSPMDYILVGAEEDPVNNPGCVSCYKTCPEGWTDVHNPWPHVCQSYEPRTEAPACPPLQTYIRTAIAIGANSLLDNNPCHCQDPATINPVRAVPTNPYLSIYDGLKWRIINPDHPGPGGETLTWWTDHPNPINSNYFVLGQKTNEITLIVKATTLEIHHRTRIKIDDQWQWVQSRVTGITRKYLGPFNGLHAGASIGRRMMSDGTYVGNRSCLPFTYDTCNATGKPEWGARWLSFDNMSLDGGFPDAQGACCFGGGACGIGLPVDCEAAGGHFAGPDTTCADCAGACCLSTGDCQDTQFDACPGSFAGFGTNCATAACRGACCLPTAECLDTTPDACPGTFKGPGTDCATTACSCPSLFADTDADLDVDQADFALLQRCFSPSGAGFPETRCVCFDRPEVGFPEGDGDIDMDDVAAFEACASGPGIPSACQ
jgi:hypothetical protein